MKITCDQNQTKANITVEYSQVNVNEVFEKYFTESKTSIPLSAQLIEECKKVISFDLYSTHAKELISKIQNELVDKAIEESIKQYSLMPVNQVHFAGDYPSFNKDYIFTLQCESLTGIDLPENLENLSVPVEALMLDKKEYHKLLDGIRRSKATRAEVTEKRLPSLGDVAILEINGSCDGTPIAQMQGTISLHFEENQKHIDMANAVSKIHVGETTSYTTTLPNDYPIDILQNKNIDMTVSFKKHYIETLPNLDENFAQSLGFKGLKELQDFANKETLKRQLQIIQQKAESKLLQSLVEPLDFPLPEVLITIAEKEFISNAKRMYTHYEKDPQKLDSSLQEMLTKNKAFIHQHVKTQSFLLALAYKEKLSVRDEDIEKSVESLAKQSQQDFQPLLKHIRESTAIYELQDQLLAEKALKFLYSKVKKIMVDPTGKEIKMTKPE